jgi:Zn-dependent peptidase ImmA (M78 family)
MPNVNPQILIWARETAGFDPSTAAKKVGIADSQSASAEAKLAEYESGAKPPSRSLLHRMANAYQRPLITFYLAAPPSKVQSGEDYRKLPSDIDARKNAIVNAIVRDVKARQQIVRDALISAEDAESLSFVNAFSISSGKEALVAAIRSTAKIDISAYRSQKTQDSAFRYLRTRIEATGVFTLLLGNLGSHHTNVGTSVFRGFALSDPIAPFVVVNDQDAKAAWSVTLLHEYAHIWIGASGISGDSLDREVEAFCDQVASETLVPEAELVADFPSALRGDIQSLINSIDAYAQSARVSSNLVAFRLFKQNKIASAQYELLRKKFYDRWVQSRERQREVQKKKIGGPSYYDLRKRSAGTALVDTAKRLLRTGELSTTEAAKILGVRALKLDQVIS